MEGTVFMKELIIYARKSLKSRLPEGKNGCLGPKNGSIIVAERVSGKLVPSQIRTYDKEGKPIKDIDFSDHKGLGSPHVHDWIYKEPQAPNKSRDTEGRALTDKEKAELEKIKDDLNSMKNGSFKDGILNGIHDEDISSITFKNNSIVINTKNHVISLMQIVETNINNLCLQNVLYRIEFNSDGEITNHEKNDSCTIKTTNNILEVIIQSSVGLNGVVICKKARIKRKNC